MPISRRVISSVSAHRVRNVCPIGGLTQPTDGRSASRMCPPFGGGSGAPWPSPRFSSADALPPLSRLIPARLGPPWLPRASPARLARPGKPSAAHRPAPCGVEHPDGDLLRMRSTTADKTAARQQAGLSIDQLMDADRLPGPCISSCSPSLSSSLFGRDADGVQAATPTRARPQAATRKICVFKWRAARGSKAAPGDAQGWFLDNACLILRGCRG
jgi:hypothetical protein